MRKFLLIAAVSGLSACSPQAEEQNDTATLETPENQEAMAMERNPVGTYDLKRYNGGTSTIVINADGTYTDTGPDGQTIDSGKFALKNGNFCFDSESAEEEVCWTVGEPDAVGSFTASDPEGHTVTLTPQAEPAATGSSEPTTM